MAAGPRVGVHIGYRKTASTWLQHEVFPNHPELVRTEPVGTPDVVEPLMRAFVVPPDRDFSPVAVRALYEQRVRELGARDSQMVILSSERLSGHPATGGHDAHRIAERLHATLPEAKVLMLVREQVSMIESDYREMVSEGYLGTVETLFEDDRWKSVGFELGRYRYDTLADCYVDLYGRENVGIFSFDTMRRDRDAFLIELADFFEIAPWDLTPDQVNRVVNRGMPTSVLRLQRLINYTRRSELNPAPLVPMRQYGRVKLEQIGWLRPGTRQILDDLQRERVRDYFKESNARLLEVYGVDVGG